MPSLRPQLPVAMESGCHPSTPLLGRRLVARHHLLGHLSSQRAYFRLSEGGWVPGDPAFLLHTRTWEVCSWGQRGQSSCEAGVWDALASSASVSACSSLGPYRRLGRARISVLQMGTNEACGREGRAPRGLRSPLHCPGGNGALFTPQH